MKLFSWRQITWQKNRYGIRLECQLRGEVFPGCQEKTHFDVLRRYVPGMFGEVGVLLVDVSVQILCQQELKKKL